MIKPYFSVGALFLAVLVWLVLQTAAVPDDKPSIFGLICIHSGSSLHYAGIYRVDSHLQVFSVGGTLGKRIVLSLSPNGILQDLQGREVYIDPITSEVGFQVGKGGSQEFSIQGLHLRYQGKEGFVACPAADHQYSLTFDSRCPGGIGVALRVVGLNAS